MRFSSELQHYVPDLHSKANLREILGVRQRSVCTLFRFWKSIWSIFSGYTLIDFAAVWRWCSVVYAPISDSIAVWRFVFWVNGKQSKSFYVGVGLRQECCLSFLLFIVYINWIDNASQADECAAIGNCEISRLIFTDDLVLLSST